MNNQEYENKKREYWENFKFARRPLNTDKKVFDYIFDRAYTLGKQEKDTNTVTIDKEEYNRLCKCQRYVVNWVPYFEVCPICGEYNQKGCICANCNNDKKLKQMKARRKSDGKVIEVTERTSWNGEKIYTADGTFYRKHELDFSVDETKEAKGEVISGWVARDYDGDVFLYQNEPDRAEIAWNGYMMHSLPLDSFPDLTWESDPLPVEIIIKRKKK